MLSLITLVRSVPDPNLVESGYFGRIRILIRNANAGFGSDVAHGEVNLQ